jgi:hypothetical protein
MLKFLLYLQITIFSLLTGCGTIAAHEETKGLFKDSYVTSLAESYFEKNNHNLATQKENYNNYILNKKIPEAKNTRNNTAFDLLTISDYRGSCKTLRCN